MSSKNIIKKPGHLQVVPFDFNSFEEKERIISKLEKPEETKEELKVDEEKLEPFQPYDLNDMIKEKLLEAEKTAENIKQEAFREGMSRGYEEGYNKGLEEAADKIKEIENIVDSIQKLTKNIMEDYREWLVNAAFAIAKHIIRAELTIKPQNLLSMIGFLMSQMEENVLITVYLNPEDLALLRVGVDIEEWAKMQDKPVVFREDTGVTRGSCRLENNVELLDASLEKIFEEFKKETLLGNIFYERNNG